MDVYNKDVTDQQYIRQVQIPTTRNFVTIPTKEQERAKGLEYEPQIKEESPEQKERQKRRNEILEESKKFDSSIQQIGNEIYHKYMEFIKAKEEEEQKKKEEELNGLYRNKDELQKNMNRLAKELVSLREEEKKEAARAEAGEETVAGGGKRKSKGKSKKVAKKPVVSQKKQSIYKEILGKQMKIYKMPDSRKEYVKYKGELLRISDYKDLMKQKAIAKTKTKVTKATKVTQQKAKSKTKK
jgi:hypothetical protein